MSENLLLFVIAMVVIELFGGLICLCEAMLDKVLKKYERR